MSGYYVGQVKDSVGNLTDTYAVFNSTGIFTAARNSKLEAEADLKKLLEPSPPETGLPTPPRPPKL